MENLKLSKKELNLLYAACMAYCGTLSEVIGKMPNEEEILGYLCDRSDETWKLARKIMEHMNDLQKGIGGKYGNISD